MRWLFTIASIAIHAGVMGWLTYYGKSPPARKPTFVAVVKPKPKPKEEEPKEDEPKPKPKPPPPVVKKAEPVVIPVAAPAPAPAAPKAAAHFASNLTFGNGPAGAVTGALG